MNASTKGAEDGRLEPSLAWVHEEQEARRALPVKLQAASTTSVKEVRRPGTAPIEWRRHLLLWAGGASSGASATQGVPNEERSDGLAKAATDLRQIVALNLTGQL